MVNEAMMKVCLSVCLRLCLCLCLCLCCGVSLSLSVSVFASVREARTLLLSNVDNDRERHPSVTSVEFVLLAQVEVATSFGGKMTA